MCRPALPACLLASALSLAAGFDPLLGEDARGPGGAPRPPRVVRTHCDQGGSLNRALTLPGDDLIVEFTGDCREDVILRRGRVTLQGIAPGARILGDASNPGPSIAVIGAGAVTLRDLTVSSQDGVAVQVVRSAGVALISTRIEGATAFGLLVDEGSSVVLVNSRSNGNGQLGIAAFGNSNLSVNGTVETSSNGLFGLLISSGSGLQSVGVGTVIANGNGLSGVAVQIGAAGQFPAVVARGNGFAGLDLQFGGNFSAIGAVDFSSNGSFGAVLNNGAVLFASGDFLDNGSAGISARGNAHVTSDTDLPTRIGGSSPLAVALDGAYGFFNNATLVGTSQLTFGARAGFGEQTVVGEILCDGTALTQGPAACASGAAAGGTSLVALPDHPLAHPVSSIEAPPLDLD
jgi:hypothetical protein